MKKSISTLFILTCLSLLMLTITSCKKEGCTDPLAENYDEKAKSNDGSCFYPTPTITKPITNGLIEIGSAYALGAAAQIKVYAKESLFNGYNYLYVATFDSASGSLLEDGHVNLHAEMDMGTMKHGTPVENTHRSAPDANSSLYAAQVIFVMPSTAGSWTLQVHYHNHTNNQEGMATIPVTVNASSNRLVQSFVASDDSSTIFLSYVLPTAPTVGVNDLEVTAHYRRTMHDHEVVGSLEIETTPEMPSMGHGSPNNIHPTHVENGHYMGKVNYTMTGLWRIHLKVKRNGVVIGENIWFDYTL